MSLFVGNISKNATIADLEDEFKKFGNCNFRNKVRSLPIPTPGLSLPFQGQRLS
jgi:RNA recognition motif-containing protein